MTTNFLLNRSPLSSSYLCESADEIVWRVLDEGLKFTKELVLILHLVNLGSLLSKRELLLGLSGFTDESAVPLGELVIAQRRSSAYGKGKRERKNMGQKATYHDHIHRGVRLGANAPENLPIGGVWGHSVL